MSPPRNCIPGSLPAASIGTRAAKRFNRLPMQPAAVSGKAAEDDAGQRRSRTQRLYCRGDRYFRGAISRKSERACRDSGKRDRSKIVVAAKLDRAEIARGELRFLPTIAAVPNWPDGMDHVPRRKVISFCDLGVAGLAAAELAALDQQLKPSRVVDGAIHPATA